MRHRKESQLIDKTLKERYPDVHPLVRKSLGFIEKGYSSKISQKELAANLGISQEYFCYLFNKDMGETFSHFLNNDGIYSEKFRIIYTKYQNKYACTKCVRLKCIVLFWFFVIYLKKIPQS